MLKQCNRIGKPHGGEPQMEEARELFSVRKITREDGRMIFTTPKSVGSVWIFAILAVGGVLIWLLLIALNELKAASLGAKAFFLLFFAGCLVTIARYFRKGLPLAAMVAREGDVIVFDRGRDALLRKGECLAALSSVKAVQINEYRSKRPVHGLVGWGSPISNQASWTVSIMLQGDVEVLELGAGYGADAGNLAATIAEYLGAPVTRVTRTGHPER
jgi:hypothetical protein